MNYRTYADMALHIKQILPKISDVDLIVGIPRSGWAGYAPGQRASARQRKGI